MARELTDTNNKGLINTTDVGGVNTFDALQDTPSDKSSSAGQFVRVNSAGTGLEYVDSTNTTSFDALTDTPASKSAGQFVRVNSAGTALEYVDAPGMGGVVVAGSIPVFNQITLPYSGIKTVRETFTEQFRYWRVDGDDVPEPYSRFFKYIEVRSTIATYNFFIVGFHDFNISTIITSNAFLTRQIFPLAVFARNGVLVGVGIESSAALQVGFFNDGDTANANDFKVAISSNNAVIIPENNAINISFNILGNSGWLFT